MAQSASWQKKTDDWREQRIAEIRTKQNDTAHRLALCEEKKKKLKADRTHRLKVCEKSYREKKLRLEQELNSYRNSIETEIKLHKQQSQERRKELVKDVKKKGEEAKVAIRNIRRDANDAVKKEAKANEISEDDQKQLEDKIQKLTDEYVKKIDQAIDAKSTEVMTV